MSKQATKRYPTSVRLSDPIKAILDGYVALGFKSRSEMVEVSLILLTELTNEYDEAQDYMETSAYLTNSDFLEATRIHLETNPSEVANAMLKAMSEMI